ncbi:MAG: hypothetical protein J0L87_15450 [Bacteroidetes bacterium]|nr:hypothetical protein [Bacteroidota bacterium]
MEHFILNQKKINLEKNKEFGFKIPVRVDTSDCEFLITNVSAEPSTDIIITFNLKSIKSGDEMKKYSVSTLSFSNSYKINLKKEDIEGEFLLVSCIANKTINIEFSILKKG